MEIHNEDLYFAMKDYVAAAIFFVANKTRQQASFNEEDFSWFWPLARQQADLSQVPHYRACLQLLQDDKVIDKHLNQRIGLTASAEKMMRLVIDLGRADKKYEFDPSYFDKQYLIFEETFYSDVQVCLALAPIEGLLWNAKPLQLSDHLEISTLKQEDLPWHWVDESMAWNSLWCCVRLKYETPKFYRESNDRGSYVKVQNEIELGVRDEIDYLVNAIRVFSNCFDTDAIRHTVEVQAESSRSIGSPLVEDSKR